MKHLRTFGFGQRAEAGLLKGLLEREGIACLVRNEQLFSALGEIPFTECFPELWVIDDETYPRASLLVENWLKGQDDSSEGWTCGGCGERLEGQFGACWQCGQSREDD
jgi:hypothetical protein